MSGGNGRNGRRPAFETDPDILTRIVEALELGHTDKDAALVAGIDPDTLSKWNTREGENYDRFRLLTTPARACGKRKRTRGIEKAGLGYVKKVLDKNGELVEVDVEPDWRALAWLLSHQYPDEFSEKRIVEHSGEITDGKPWREAVKDPDYRDALKTAARCRMGLQGRSVGTA